MDKEESIGKVELDKIESSILRELVHAGLITDQGVRIGGIGIVIRKLEAMCELQDKTNLKIYGLTKDLEKVRSDLADIKTLLRKD